MLTENYKDIKIGRAFFEEIRDHSMPLDVGIISKLKTSTLKLDIYFWLTCHTKGCKN